MKRITLIIFLGAIIFCLCLLSIRSCIILEYKKAESTEYENSMTVYSFQTHIPLEDFYKKVTGYDSIQLIIRDGKLEGNFCYPNEWEFEKWKIYDTYSPDSPGVISMNGRSGHFQPDTIKYIINGKQYVIAP